MARPLLIASWLCALAPACVGVSSPAGSDGGADSGAGSSVDGGLVGPLPATVSGTLTVSGAHDAPQDVTIAPGATLILEAGADVTFAPGARLIVHGQLTISGSNANAVTLSGQSAAGPWGGVLVEQAGSAQMSFVHLTGAGTGAPPNAALDVAQTAGAVTLSDALVDSSAPALSLSASATIQRVTVHNASAPVNGPVLLLAGNPTLTDVLVDNGSIGTDAVVINGGGPQISHLTVRGHHCCIHTNASTQMRVDAMDCDNTDVVGFMFYSSFGVTGAGGNITAAQSVGAYNSNGPIDLQGNYWVRGGPPVLSGADAPLVDAGNWATQPFPDAGMR